MDIQPWSLHQLDQLDEDKDSSTVLGIIERAQRERDILNSIEGGRANQNNNTGGGDFHDVNDDDDATVSTDVVLTENYVREVRERRRAIHEEREEVRVVR